MAQVTTGLIIHSPMDGLAGGFGALPAGTTIPDTFGTAQNGTTVNTNVQYQAGLLGDGVVRFPQSSSHYVNYGNVANPGASSMTVAGWVDISSVTTAVEMVVGKGNAASSNDGWSIWETDGTLYVRGNDSNNATRWGQNIANISDNTWYHVAMVVDRENDVVRGYLNGSNIGWNAGGGGATTDVLAAGGTLTNGDSLFMGRRLTSGAAFGGDVDDFGLWHRALGESEVQALYISSLDGNNIQSAAVSTPPSNEVVPLAEWTLDDGKLDTTIQGVADTSGNGNFGFRGANVGADAANDPDWRTTGLGTAKADPVGTLGAVLSFDGDGGGTNQDRVNFSGHAGTLQTVSEGTISLWARLDDSDFDSGPQCLFCASDSGDASSELRLFFNEGSGAGTPHNIQFGIRNDGSTLTDIATAADIVTEDEWYHVAVTVDSSGTILYVDGVLGATSTSTAFFDDVLGLDSVLLGANDDSGGGVQWELDGKLSDVRIYDKALSFAQIGFLANPDNLGLAITIPEPSTLALAALSLLPLGLAGGRRRRR
jgi:hypothetical protein